MELADFQSLEEWQSVLATYRDASHLGLPSGGAVSPFVPFVDQLIINSLRELHGTSQAPLACGSHVNSGARVYRWAHPCLAGQDGFLIHSPHIAFAARLQEAL